MNNAMVASRTVAGQDPSKTYAAACRLTDVIYNADIEEFISAIESFADRTDLFAVLNTMKPGNDSLLYSAACARKDDILRLLIDSVGEHLIDARDEWGNTPLHMVAGLGGSTRAAEMLIRRARDRPNVKDKNHLLRIKNKQGNTTLHRAVMNRHADLVRYLLSEDLEPVYWENAFHRSPLYEAILIDDSKLHEVLFSLPLEPSRIEGLPPVHGAIAYSKRGLFTLILEKNMKLFAMTNSRGGNVFHLAAYLNLAWVFEFLRPETTYLAQKWDKNGDLPIHIASKMGYVELIEKLKKLYWRLNWRGQTILHVTAKYGRASVVKYILRDPVLRRELNVTDYAGNTALHLAAMHSQPATLIPLVLDERINPFLPNHQPSTALDIALNCVRREYTLRKQLTVMVLASTCGKRPTGNEAFPIIDTDKKKPSMDHLKNLIGNRSVVATLVATVTFAVPGGFNSSDTASNDDRGMATMLDNRMFQAFAICNTLTMFCSMIAVVTLLLA